MNETQDKEPTLKSHLFFFRSLDESHNKAPHKNPTRNIPSRFTPCRRCHSTSESTPCFTTTILMYLLALRMHTTIYSALFSPVLYFINLSYFLSSTTHYDPMPMPRLVSLVLVHQRLVEIVSVSLCTSSAISCR